MTLNRSQILEANDLVLESVDVPEWGGSVVVRAMTGADRDAFENSLYTFDAAGKAKQELSNMRMKLLAMTIVDDNGNRLFSADDIGALGRKGAAPIERVYAVAQRLNLIGASGEAAAAKNSASGQSSDSGTGSPDTSASPSESVSAT